MSTIPPKRMPESRKQSETDAPGHSLGAGSEAAEGIHGAGVTSDAHADTALDARMTGVSSREGAMRAGSEPLLDRSVEHRPGYGGEGGAPRTSADEREHLDANGQLESED